MKTFFLLVLLSVPLLALAENESALQAIIQASGYRCDTVDSVNPYLVGKGYHVFCNNFAYRYDVEDVGGRLVVKPK